MITLEDLWQQIKSNFKKSLNCEKIVIREQYHENILEHQRTSKVSLKGVCKLFL